MAAGCGDSVSEPTKEDGPNQESDQTVSTLSTPTDEPVVAKPNDDDVSSAEEKDLDDAESNKEAVETEDIPEDFLMGGRSTITSRTVPSLTFLISEALLPLKKRLQGGHRSTSSSIDPALAGKDLVVRSKTGTGKTAVRIPMIERIQPAIASRVDRIVPVVSWRTKSHVNARIWRNTKICAPP